MIAKSGYKFSVSMNLAALIFLGLGVFGFARAASLEDFRFAIQDGRVAEEFPTVGSRGDVVYSALLELYEKDPFDSETLFRDIASVQDHLLGSESAFDVFMGLAVNGILNNYLLYSAIKGKETNDLQIDRLKEVVRLLEYTDLPEKELVDRLLPLDGQVTSWFREAGISGEEILEGGRVNAIPIKIQKDFSYGSHLQVTSENVGDVLLGSAIRIIEHNRLTKLLADSLANNPEFLVSDVALLSYFDDWFALNPQESIYKSRLLAGSDVSQLYHAVRQTGGLSYNLESRDASGDRRMYLTFVFLGFLSGVDAVWKPFRQLVSEQADAQDSARNLIEIKHTIRIDSPKLDSISAQEMARESQVVESLEMERDVERTADLETFRPDSLVRVAFALLGLVLVCFLALRYRKKARSKDNPNV